MRVYIKSTTCLKWQMGDMMKKVWTLKNGRRTAKITFTIERTTLEDKLTFLGSVVVLGFVYYFFFR